MEEKIINKKLERYILKAFNDTKAICNFEKCNMRKAAYILGINRILEAERIRGNI